MCMCVSDHVATTLLWRHVECLTWDSLWNDINLYVQQLTISLSSNCAIIQLYT